MKEIVADPQLVAYCGLYCGACSAYLKERCPGCHENDRATWCKVRSCCIERDFASCADCEEISDPMDCRKYNNFMAKVFGFVFRSDRAACVRQIGEIGIEEHAENMAQGRCQTIKK
jgi:uncharacterized protein DUF3795